MFMIAQSIVSSVIGKIGRLVTNHAMVESNIGQEKSKHLLRMEASFAKETLKRFKSVTPSRAQLVANGTLGMNGNNAANLVEVESLQELETSNNTHNWVDKNALEMPSRPRNVTNKIVQLTANGIHGAHGKAAQRLVGEEDKKGPEPSMSLQPLEVDHVKDPKNNLEVAITLPVQGIVLGKSLDTGEAVANHVEEENKPEKEKSNKRQRMGESNAPETEPKQEHAMKRNAKLKLIANGDPTEIGVIVPNLVVEDSRPG